MESFQRHDMKINPTFHGLIPPLAAEEYAQLESNILKDGCRDPLVTWNGTLIDGHNRYEICQKHGIEYDTKPLQFADEAAACDWIDANQLGRRNLTPDQRSIIRGRMYNRTKKAAHGREGRTFSGSQSDTPKDTATTIGEKHGVSRATVIRDGKRAEALDNLEKTNPEEARAVRDGLKRFNEVQRQQKEAVRESQRQANRAKIAKAPAVEKIQAVFSTIVIDPPWDWGDEGDCDQLGRAKPNYATMTLEELCRLPIGTLSAKDCHLYLWITNRSMPKGGALMTAWGFRYITALTWPKPSFGMGNYFRGQTEHVLFGVKGSQPLKRKDASTLLPVWKRGPHGHSSKPVEFHGFVESCSPGPYLEMFSRSERKDWTVWGEGK